MGKRSWSELSYVKDLSSVFNGTPKVIAGIWKLDRGNPTLKGGDTGGRY